LLTLFCLFCTARASDQSVETHTALFITRATDGAREHTADRRRVVRRWSGQCHIDVAWH